VYLSLGQPKFALKELERVTPLAVRQPGLSLDLIRARIASHQYKRALAELAALPGPRSSDVEALEAQARLGLGEHAAAAALLERATVRDPQAVSLQIATARLALARNDLDGAVAATRQALNLAPDDPDALLLDGRLALARGDFARAAASFELAAAHASKRNEALAGQAEALLSQRKPDAPGPGAGRA
jgi:tetratricopeptide (TPR) repeat protein